MRIGIVTGEYPPMRGGVGAYTQILARQLVRQGQEIFVFSSEAAQSSDIHLTNTIQRWGLSSLRAVDQWAQHERLDLINLQFQTAAYAMSPWIHFLPDTIRHIPVVTTFHDLRFPYLFPKAGSLRDWIVMHLARRSAGVIVTNHEDAENVHALPRVKLIPIGSNILTPLPPDFDPNPWREKAGAREDDFLLAYFGLLNRSKGIENLLDSLSALRAFRIPARLVMIGDTAGTSDPTNAAYAAEINRLIQKKELPQHIYRTGFVDDLSVASYLKASDVVVLPFIDGASYRRGSLMAAIQYGCTIVTTQPTVNIPAFIDGKNLRFVPLNKSRWGFDNGLYIRLRELYESLAQRKILQKGATQLAQQFTWSQIAADTIEFFQRIIGART
jgi:glycosyltransferase involved in cell wall biosynthesis